MSDTVVSENTINAFLDDNDSSFETFVGQYETQLFKSYIGVNWAYEIKLIFVIVDSEHISTKVKIHGNLK